MRNHGRLYTGWLHAPCVRQRPRRLSQCAPAAACLPARLQLHAQLEVLRAAAADKLARLDSGDYEDDDAAVEAFLAATRQARTLMLHRLFLMRV